MRSKPLAIGANPVETANIGTVRRRWEWGVHSRGGARSALLPDGRARQLLRRRRRLRSHIDAGQLRAGLGGEALFRGCVDGLGGGQQQPRPPCTDRRYAAGSSGLEMTEVMMVHGDPAWPTTSMAVPSTLKARPT